MIKKISTTIAIATLSCMQAQNIGINTIEPQRSLDVNGSLKVTNLANKTNVNTYKEIVTASNSTGNIDKITIPSVYQHEVYNVEIARSIYLGTTPDNSKSCSCGEITFKLKTDNLAYFHLNTKKVFETNNNATSITLAYGAKRWTDTDYTYNNITGKIFTSTNYSTDQQLDDVSFNSNNSTRIYTLVLPKQNNLYRLTVSALKNTSTNNIYSLICEKFYIQEVL